jgi:hypothetical protein
MRTAGKCLHEVTSMRLGVGHDIEDDLRRETVDLRDGMGKGLPVRMWRTPGMSAVVLPRWSTATS